MQESTDKRCRACVSGLSLGRAVEAPYLQHKMSMLAELIESEQRPRAFVTVTLDLIR
jgi:hypothetical protein